MRKSIRTGLSVLVVILCANEAPAKKPIDPNTLVVNKPLAPTRRNPLKAVKKLLRIELSILEAAEALDFNIGRRTGELKQLRQQLGILERDLATTTQHFEAQTKKLNENRVLVRRRMRAMIQFRKTASYQLLFGSQSYSNVLRRQRTIRKLLEADKIRISNYRMQLEKWQQARDDLKRRKRNVSNTQQQIRYLMQELQWDREEKTTLLEAVRKKASFHGEVARELEGVDQALAKLVRKLRTGKPRLWFEERLGKHIRPIRRGVTVGKYGKRVHKRFGTTTMHRGLAMRPDSWDGTSDVPIRAVYHGYVVYTGWKRGLGNVVLLDHTRGYMTLYGHLEKTTVKKGDFVKPGQKIGLMGDSGSLWGKRLHFEIRKHGKAIDPTRWFL